jgi:integrase
MNELRRQLTVNKSAGEVRGHGWEEGPTKTGRARSVPIPRYVLEALLKHIEDYAGGQDALLFTGPDGGPLRPNNWRKRVWYPACERARARELLDAKKPLPHPHDLRHTAAILAMEDGVAPRVVQDILGHSSYRVTMEIYARKASEELMQQAAEAMDAGYRESAGKGV